MRPFVGFVAINAWLLVVGWGGLRCLGLVSRGGWRSLLSCLGPCFLFGIASLLPPLCVALVAGVPLTLLTAFVAGAIMLAIAELASRRVRGDSILPVTRRRSGGPGRRELGWRERWLPLCAVGVAGAYALSVAFAFASSPTRGDDARIWSLRGLTLAYYHVLQPEIFLNPFQAGAHPVYPLLQPAVEALISEAMGSPQLRLYHTEVWMVVFAAIWSAAFLIYRWRGQLLERNPAWLGVLALLALSPIVTLNVYVGDADVSGSMLLAVGALGFAHWVARGDRASLAWGAVMVTAAGCTKDEDFLAASLVLAVAGAFALCELLLPNSRRVGLRVIDWLIAAAYFVVLIAPWRIWLAAHNLTDSVEPPLPRALSPIYVIHQHRVHRVVSAMLLQVLQQWGWLAPIFIVTCAVCLLTRTAVRATVFCLAISVGLVLAMIWLYVATPLSLDFLIPTSMDRTVGVFMVPAGIATAYLLSALLSRTPELSAAGPSAEPLGDASAVGLGDHVG
jgi:hypothetical protein